MDDNLQLTQGFSELKSTSIQRSLKALEENFDRPFCDVIVIFPQVFPLITLPGPRCIFSLDSLPQDDVTGFLNLLFSDSRCCPLNFNNCGIWVAGASSQQVKK